MNKSVISFPECHDVQRKLDAPDVNEIRTVDKVSVSEQRSLI